MVALRSSRVRFFGISLAFALLRGSGAKGVLGIEDASIGKGGFLEKSDQITHDYIVEAAAASAEVAHDSATSQELLSFESSNTHNDPDSDYFIEKRLLARKEETEHDHTQGEMIDSDPLSIQQEIEEILPSNASYDNDTTPKEVIEPRILPEETFFRQETFEQDINRNEIIDSEESIDVDEYDGRNGFDDRFEYDQIERVVDNDVYDDGLYDRFNNNYNADSDFGAYIAEIERSLQAYARALAPMKGFGYGYSHYGLGHLYSGTNLFGGFINPSMYAGYPTPPPVYGGYATPPMYTNSYALASPPLYGISSTYGGGAYGF